MSDNEVIEAKLFKGPSLEVLEKHSISENDQWDYIGDISCCVLLFNEKQLQGKAPGTYHMITATSENGMSATTTQKRHKIYNYVDSNGNVKLSAIPFTV